ncbi:MAG: hypothetical protein WC783_00090 [Candidatus Paceibacterota bacterium]|jgi:hypothetical protein
MKAFTDYMYRPGVSPITKSALSTRNKVFSFAAGQGGKLVQIGQIKRIGFKQTRSVTPTRGIGFGDVINELIPNNMEPITIDFDIFSMYTITLQQVLGYNYGIDGYVRALKHHKFPFDIRNEMVLPAMVAAGEPTSYLKSSLSTQPTGGPQAVVTVYQGCWLTDYSTESSVDDIIISETGSITVTEIIAGGATKYFDENSVSGNATGTNPWSTLYSKTQGK